MKQKNFRRMLEKAIASPGASYATLNLKSNPFIPLPSLDAMDELLVDRNNAKEQLTTGIEDMLQGELPTITILGGKGIGKTHLLLSVFKTLREISFKHPSIETYFVRTSAELANFRNQLLLSQGEQKSEKMKVLFIDEAEKKWVHHYDDIDLLIETKIKIIWAWNAQTWKAAKRSALIPPKTRIVLLDKLSDDYILELLAKRLDYYKIDKGAPHPFTLEALKILADTSDGVPYTAINLADRCLYHVIKRGTKIIGRDSVLAFLEESNIRYGKEVKGEVWAKMRKLSHSQFKVLETVYINMTSYDRGTTITNVAQKLNLTPPTVFVHMKRLNKLGILQRKKVGKEVLYSIQGEYLALLETMMDKRNEN